jgi:subtilisin family serine protease
MNVLRAQQFTAGENVIIAVIDTGIDTNHPDFSGRISPLSYNSYTEKVGLEHAHDDHGHGTAVAGIAAGKSTGTAPGAVIMAIKANKPETGEFESESVIRGIDYAVENGANIINLSFGRPFIDEDGDCGFDTEIYQAVLNAVENGVIVISSAGNSAEFNANYPGAHPQVIAVSSTRQGLEFDYEISNYGPQIDISAPGKFIITTILGGGYGLYSGTSMATPSVSGITALIMSYNPDLTTQEVRQAIFTTARPAGTPDSDGKCIYYGFGIINAGRAVESIAAYIYTITDALEILTYLAGMTTFSAEQYKLYDLTGDGVTDINDALHILMILAGMVKHP